MRAPSNSWRRWPAHDRNRCHQGDSMAIQGTRREILRGGLAVMGLGALGIPEWALPALAQSEVIVAFADQPATLPAAAADRRTYDIRTIDGPFTPKDQF